jgi:outer membrane usher protein
LPLLLASALVTSLPSLALADTSASAAAPAVIDDIGDSIDMGSGEDLYLDVVLNQQPTGRLAHFRDRDGALYASRGTLRQLGFKLADAGADPVRVDSLPGVKVDYQINDQRVAIDAPLSQLDLDTTVLNQQGNRVPHATASPGLLLNYDLYATQGQHGESALNAYTELRAFAAAGVLDSTQLTQVSRASGGGDWHGNSVRLDTSWQTSWPSSMLTMTLGDTLTGALDWSRATHIAGVQFSRNFSLQPYRITTPVPAFLGEAAVPSAVDLYVNGIKQYSGEVGPGPFQLNGLPVISGAGSAQVVLTDAFGRSTSVNFPFYTTGELLQAGLSDWSGELGVVRKNYGIESFDYGHDPVASGVWRYGVNDRFTAEAHAEASSDIALAGLGGVALLGQAGVIDAALSHSSGEGHSGSQYRLGYQWRSGPFNFAANSTRTQGDYRDIAAQYGAAPPEVSEQALVGLSTMRAGSFSVSYLHQRYSGEDDARYASAYWFRSFGSRWSGSLSLNQNLDESRDRTLFLGLTVSLDSRTMLSASAQRDHGNNSFSVDVSRPVSGDGGYGWRAQVRDGNGQSGGMAEAGYRGTYGQVTGGVNAYGDSRYAYADFTGSLVLMGDHLFAARHVDDAFAVVSTDGIADVPVKLENRVIGRTDKDGMLLVTPLNAWQDNQLAIDPMQLPADLRIDHVKTLATPTARAGALVRFGIHPIRAASVILVDAKGKPLPVGSAVRIRGQQDHGAIVGFDGAVYLDTLDEHNTLDVDTPAGMCSTSFDYHKQGDEIPEIGPLACRAETK